MKIIQLIHKPQNRGAEIFACQMTNHLLQLGHEVKVVSVFSGTAALPYKGPIKSLNAIPSRKLMNISAYKNLSKIIKDYRPDIIQANSGDTLKYAVISKFLFKWDCPIISRNASEVGKYFKTFLQKKWNHLLYKKVRNVISVSKASEKDLLNHFPFLKGRTTVIPVGIEYGNSIRFYKIAPSNKKHIIHVGGFSFEKNHIGLFRIFSNVLKVNSRVHLHLVGDGPLRKDMEKMVHSMNLNENVTFYGYIPDPLPIVKTADVLVLPSIIEGLPGVILEAMYCKTPVIAYNVGGISEVLNDQTGNIVAKGNETEFTKNVLEIIDNLDHKKIECAFNQVNNSFMNDKLVLKFVNNYTKSLL